MQCVKFNLGEQRHIKLLIHAMDGAPFTIRDASWELKCNGVIEAEGTCEVEEHMVDAYISPEKRTTYALEITYKPADEKRVELIEVVVT